MGVSNSLGHQTAKLFAHCERDAGTGVSIVRKSMKEHPEMLHRRR